MCSVAQLCLQFWDFIDYSLPGFSVHGIIPAEILEWVGISSSRASSWLRDRKALLSPAVPALQEDSLWLRHLGSLQFSSVQSLSHVRLFATPWITARQASLSITNFRSSLRLTSIEAVMPSNHLVLCHLFLLMPSIIPSNRVFSKESVLRINGQSIGTSASVLPMNIQDWFPLGLTDLMSLRSKELSRIFSNTTVQKHQFFGIQSSLWSNSHVHTWPLEKP